MTTLTALLPTPDSAGGLHRLWISNLMDYSSRFLMDNPPMLWLRMKLQSGNRKQPNHVISECDRLFARCWLDRLYFHGVD